MFENASLHYPIHIPGVFYQHSHDAGDVERESEKSVFFYHSHSETTTILCYYCFRFGTTAFDYAIRLYIWDNSFFFFRCFENEPCRVFAFDSVYRTYTHCKKKCGDNTRNCRHFDGNGTNTQFKTFSSFLFLSLILCVQKTAGNKFFRGWLFLFSISWICVVQQIASCEWKRKEANTQHTECHRWAHTKKATPI